jgi:hypothetical protein
MERLGVIESKASVAGELRAVAITWGLAMILPLPVLAATDPATSGDVSCLYLGLASGWLAVEFHRVGGPPQSPRAWRRRTLAVASAVAVNVVVFVSFGLAAAVRTHFPFPLMAALSAVPAVGLIPWLLRRVGHPHGAILCAASLLLVAKLAACVVARIVYGPDYMAQGYVSADWRTAKLMISLFWSLSTLLSVGLLLADYRSCQRAPPTELQTTKAEPPAPVAGGAV